MKKSSSKLYYSIGEVSKHFNLNTSTIRFWENEFEVLKPKKNKKGNRLFTPQDMEYLQLIHHLLKERGFTLEGAKKKLKENKNETLNHHEMLKSLQKIKTFLLELKSEL